MQGSLSFYSAMASILLIGSGMADANLLRNPSFEEAAPSSPRKALHWSAGEPDAHGNTWGSASREDWRSYDGLYILTVRGTWADAGDRGGIWQEVEATPGETYRAAAWFWADPDWNPRLQEMKLEFYDAEHSRLLDFQSVTLGPVPPEWSRREVRAQAPADAAWVRFVINVEGANDHGALQFDHLYLNTVSDFDEPAPKPLDVIIDILDE